MANFPTHLLGATSVGIVSTAILGATELLPLASVASGVGVGIVALGGIFPDVDSDYSDAIHLVFDILSVAVAVPLMIAAVPMAGLLVSVILLLLVYLTIRYVLIVPFRWYTVHRGRFHSVPMGALLASVVALVAHRGIALDPVQSWLFGGLFLLGFLTHLLLDEMYSVDLGNRVIKRSFGTAMKLFDRDDLRGYGLLYGLLAIALMMAPSPIPLSRAIQQVDVQLLPPQSMIDRIAGR